MAKYGILSRNYYIDPDTVSNFGAKIYNMMMEADQAMAEASEVIAEIASLTERVPSQIRCGALLEACETAQAEIKNVDFFSYGQKVNQGLQNLLDHNQYITEHFIKKMQTHTEKMRGLGEEFRKLADSITYADSESAPLKGISLSAVSVVENENTDGEEENSSDQAQDDIFLRAGAAEVLEIKIEEVKAQVRNINQYNEQYKNNLESGKKILLNYMSTHGIVGEDEIENFINWLVKKRPGLLVELYIVDSKSCVDVGNVFDNILEYYDLYQAEQGAIILANFIERNSEAFNDAQKPELIFPFLYFFHSSKLIDLYEIKNVSEQEKNCQQLIDFYLEERDNLNTFRGEIFYAYTWLQINSIENFTHDNDLDFDQLVEKFVSIYKDHIDIYNKIAEETGVPSEVVAVIHYRENSSDFLEGNFDAFLQNGRIEGDMSQDEFIRNAIEAIQSKQYCIDAYNLSYDSNDIVAMVCFAEAYNGMGSYDNDLISAYSYSGTDVYVSGKYISDGNYDQDVIDQQVGTYRLLLAAVAGIYEVEDGKNYVNRICEGDF